IRGAAAAVSSGGARSGIRDARAHDARRGAAARGGERDRARGGRARRARRPRRRGDRARQPRRRDPRLRRVGELLRAPRRREERRRRRAAPAGLGAQAVSLRARFRTARRAPDDDPPRRPDDVRDPGDARVRAERLQHAVRARIALADSLNIPAVRVLSAVGVNAFLRRLRALGFAHLTQDADHYGLGLALGDGEVSLEELASAYATIANGGRVVRAHALLAETPGESRTVGSAREWALVTDMLADAHARARAFGVASLLR